MNNLKSNENLIKLLKKGDMIAFDEIYEKYCRRLYGFVFHFIKQEADAEGIVQEVFIRIWESRKKIDSFTSFESFVFTIAYNTTINLLRKKVNEKRYLEFLKDRQQISSTNEIIDEIHFKEINENIQNLLKRLTPRQREIFLLSREEGFTHSEIAKKLNISPNTVKNHMVSVLSYLKTNLDSTLIVNALFVSLFL